MAEEEKIINEEENQETNNPGPQVAPSATFLNSIVLSVRLADESMRHIQFSIFEDDETHLIKVFYDVIDPRQVHFGK